MSEKSKSCTSCSYYITQTFMHRLSHAEQIEIEEITDPRKPDTEEIPMLRFAVLHQKMQCKQCIGGLVDDDQVIDHCKYYRRFDNTFNSKQLRESFNEHYQRISTTGQNRITNVLAVASLLLAIIVAYSGYKMNQVTKKNELLQAEMVKNENEHMQEMQTQKDSIQSLHSIINKLNTNEQAGPNR